MDLSKLWELVQDREAGVLQFMGLQRVRHNLATEQQQNSNCYETHRFIQRVKVDIHRDNAEFHWNTEIFLMKATSGNSGW